MENARKNKRWMERLPGWIVFLLFAAMMPAIGPATPASAAGATYYVATNGSDSNPGTFDSPFRTIQHAADVTAPGDTVLIRGGTYRETVNVTQSGTASEPIVFAPYEDESVTISGADLVPNNWQSHSGNIYKTNVAMALADGNQVFVGGALAHEARWPNFGPGRLVAPQTATTGTGTTATSIRDTNMPNIDLTGARLWVTGNYRFVAWTSTITASSDHTISFDSYSPDTQNDVTPLTSQYFLSGKLGLLDEANEWYYDEAAGSLYLWVPGGGNPGGTVEVKRRSIGIDLIGSSFVTFERIGLFAATINTSTRHDGDRRAVIAGQGSTLAQTVYGLQPYTSYMFSGIIAATDGEQVRVGVANYGGSEQTYTTRQNYRHVFQLRFTTGSNTSADIYMTKDSGGGAAYGDGFGIIDAVGSNLVPDGSFEDTALSHWTVTGTAYSEAGANATDTVLDGIDATYISHDAKLTSYYVSETFAGIYFGGERNTIRNSRIANSSGNGVYVDGTDNRLVNNEFIDCNYNGTGDACIRFSSRSEGTLVSHNTAQHAGRSITTGWGRNSRIQYNDFGYAGYLTEDLGIMYGPWTDGEGTQVDHNLVHDNLAPRHGHGIYLDNGTHNFLVFRNKVYNLPAESYGIFLNVPGEYNIVANNDGSVGGGYAVIFPDDQWGTLIANNKGDVSARLSKESKWLANDPAGGTDAGVVVPGITDGYTGQAPDIGADEQGAASWTAGRDFANPPDPAFTSIVAPYRNTLANGGFESGTMTGWTAAGTGTQELSIMLPDGFRNPYSTTHTGSIALRFDGDASSLSQTVTGLMPSTAYTFGVWMRVNAGATGQLRVSGTSLPDQELSVADTGGTWLRQQVRFATGTADTSAVVTVAKTTSGPDAVYMDDAGVAPDLFNPDLYSLLNNGGFELNTADWTTAGASYSRDTANKRSGSYSGKSSARIAAWAGLRQNVQVVNGRTYRATAWAKLASGADWARLGISYTVGGNTVTRMLAENTIGSAGFNELSGTYTILEAGPVTNAQLFVLTYSSTADLYIDDFSFRETGGLLTNGGFESGSGSWTASGATLARDSAVVHSGVYGGKATSRSGPTSSLRQSVTLKNGQTYDFSGWSRLGSGTDTVKLTAAVVVGGTTYYRDIATAAVPSNSWRQLKGTYTFAESGPIDSATVYFQTASSTADLYTDDMAVNRSLQPLINPGFESGALFWSGVSATVAANTADRTSGLASALVTARASANAGLSQPVTLVNGMTYTVSAWAKLASGTDTGELVAKVTVNGATYYRTLAFAALSSSAWTPIRGTYTFSEAGPIASAELLVRTTSTTASLGVDEVALEPLANVFANASFENGTSGWTAISSSIAADSGVFHSGAYGGKVSGRTATYSAMIQNVPLTNHTLYYVSVWAKLASGTDTAKLLAKFTVNGATVYRTVLSGTINDAQWTQLSGYYAVDEPGTLTLSGLYLTTNSSLANLYSDDYLMYPVGR
ncbi:carbohydrate binding domain-containing protein [Paenibacillus cymbidii]|uniref:carbohydrate binding domain-containing protein n=1 Tax=Paenibacillus cymbidii TaxID=1639034 RepID=UPI001436C196|nr:carbohydrate binding domain-containing protein [Paenibacillus cymbidii]